MTTSHVAVVDVVPEPKGGKCSKSKDPQTLAKESALLKNCMRLQEDSVAKVDEHCFVLTCHVGMIEDRLNDMEDNIAAAMATFCEQLRHDLSYCDND